MIEIDASLTHPMVFIFDYENLDVDIPDVSGETLVTASDSCIAVQTVVEIDGDVSISVFSASEVVEKEIYKVGTFYIVTPTGRLSVVSAKDKELAYVQISKKDTYFNLYANDFNSPTTVYVELVDKE
jgi:hypothetical protein